MNNGAPVRLIDRAQILSTGRNGSARRGGVSLEIARRIRRAMAQAVPAKSTLMNILAVSTDQAR